MNPITLARSRATSNSLFVIALCIDSNRPELGFQSNHSDRRLSTAGASVFKALLTTGQLGKTHLGPSGTWGSQTHADKAFLSALSHARVGVGPPPSLAKAPAQICFKAGRTQRDRFPSICGSTIAHTSV